MPSTVRLHRVLHAPPERVYRAFLDADAYAKWLPPNGFTCKVHQLDARVGGTYRATFTNFSTGNGHSFGGKYLELVPNERIRHDDQFAYVSAWEFAGDGEPPVLHKEELTYTAIEMKQRSYK